MSDNDDDDEVGYRKPPRRYRWAKGVSGNPKGRPANAGRSWSDRQFRRDFMHIMNSQITVKTHQGVKKMTGIEAILWQTFQRALSGHAPSMRFMINTAQQVYRDHLEANSEMLRNLEFTERLYLKEDPADDRNFVEFMTKLQRKLSRRA